MKKTTTLQFLRLTVVIMMMTSALQLFGSSHREAPMISSDPLADNTDLYAFRSPDNPNMITIIANYIPMQLPHGGPNYYTFGQDVRYEIHIDNNINTSVTTGLSPVKNGDDIVYRFTFTKVNEDPTTFFNIRLGMQNQKTTYKVERSMNGGKTFTLILTSGKVPPYNVGPRSISGAAGLNAPSYESLFTGSFATASTGEIIFAGPVDDPFFVDLGGIFDLGNAPRQSGPSRDGLGCYNASAIAIQIPISTLQKDKKNVSQAINILDPDFVIGVWASASRRKITVLNGVNPKVFPAKPLVEQSGEWVQISRIGMPLTNEAVIPIGQKDVWNFTTPYNEVPSHNEYFYNPELALYMDDDLFGGAVPSFAPLRIQKSSLQTYDFTNGANGLYPLKGSAAVAGTALDDAVFGKLLLPAAGKPRSVDLWPIFHTGVPNARPYQLATGKNGNPLAAGKPFINNFLPNGGDMLRLNMAVPPTDRNSPSFNSLGLVWAAVLGLTDPTFANTSIQFIPNMDGFPNGRRLEDDVTRIELQAVSGVVLAAIGLWYDDYTAGGANPVTQDLMDVLGYSTGVEKNDTSFRAQFPYVQLPWSGTGKCSGTPVSASLNGLSDVNLGMTTPAAFMAPKSVVNNGDVNNAAVIDASGFPNPFKSSTTIQYHVAHQSDINVAVYNMNGKLIRTLENSRKDAGSYEINWDADDAEPGFYMVVLTVGNIVIQTLKVMKSE